MSATQVDHKQQISDFFDQDITWQGDVYSTSSDPHAAGVRRRFQYVLKMLSTLPQLRGGIVLDAGCGPGTYLEALAKRGFRCYGIELSAEMLKICRKNLDPGLCVDVRSGDIENLPFQDNSFDLLLSIGVIQYLSSLDLALQEISRVIKPGGYIVLSFENLYSLGNIDWVLRKKIRSMVRSGRAFGSIGENDGLSMVSDYFLRHSNVPHEYRLYNPWMIEELLRAVGFLKVSSLTYGFELRSLRKIPLISEHLIDNAEIVFERFIQNNHFPYFPYSGKFYIGVFQKGLQPVREINVLKHREMALCAVCA